MVIPHKNYIILLKIDQKYYNSQVIIFSKITEENIKLKLNINSDIQGVLPVQNHCFILFMFLIKCCTLLVVLMEVSNIQGVYLIWLRQHCFFFDTLNFKLTCF